MADTNTARAQPADVPDAARPADQAGIDLAPFRAGRAAEDRLVDLVAFGLAHEQRQVPLPDAVARLRHEAAAVLSDHAFRYLHNAIDQIRRDAVAEQFGTWRKPPGVPSIFLASLLAAALVGLGAIWLTHPETLTGLLGRLGG